MLLTFSFSAKMKCEIKIVLNNFHTMGINKLIKILYLKYNRVIVILTSILLTAQ